MLQNVDDDVLRAAMKSGILVPVLIRYFGLTPSKPGNIETLAIECKHMDDDECKHLETHVLQLPQYCSYCSGYVSLSTGACIDCDKMADVPTCGQCGADPCEGRMMRHQCTGCHTVLCNRCNNLAKSKIDQKDEEGKLLDMINGNHEASFNDQGEAPYVASFKNIVAL
eukprot:4365525-Pyramimonas_sp.AAC.1